jgi:GT2 family glycosyltransferase
MSNTSLKASFVLVNYNRKDELMITLAKTKEIISYSPQDFEIVVVDNASVDGSAEAVKANYPDVVLIENKVNTGAPAWNLGFEKAKGEYFIIIDDDSHIISGLKEALEHMDRHTDIGILALNITSGPYTSEDMHFEEGKDTILFIGCGAIFRKTVYEKVGGYAEWIFLYANEWDLGLRVWDAGYKVAYFAGCLVDHRASKTNRSSKRLRVLCTKHEMAIINKYFGQNRTKYLFRVAINSLKAVNNGKFKDAWYNVIGVYEFLSMKKQKAQKPVSEKIEKIFTDTYWGTKPAFAFILKAFSN